LKAAEPELYESLAGIWHLLPREGNNRKGQQEFLSNTVGRRSADRTDENRCLRPSAGVTFMCGMECVLLERLHLTPRAG
jgi:hypothetical protein